MNAELRARMGHDIGDVCDALFARVASGIEAFGRDAEERLDAKHESPSDAQTPPDTPKEQQS